MAKIRNSKVFQQKDHPKAKERQLKSDWEKLLKRHGLDSVPKRKYRVFKEMKTNILNVQTRDTGPVVPSLSSYEGAATKGELKVYTGNKIVGIATMHKSNLVPIFNDEAAVEVAKMRRG